MVFARHVVGVVEFQHLIESRRCMSGCRGDIDHVLHQASSLTISQMTVLHQVLESDNEAWNHLFAGMCLFCIYARSRWSDAQHGQAILFDKDSSGEVAYVEVATAVQKTARALKLRHMFLPLVAPSRGVTSCNWGRSWECVRNQFGLDLEIYPLMPAPDQDSRPTVRPLGTDEASFCLASRRATRVLVS